MKNILKALSLIIIIAFSIALVPTQKAYADSGLYAIPSDVTTNSETTKVTLPTLDSDCYVLYTSVQDQDPDQSEMWRIPAGTPNVQDFNIPGTWWLHVYVPDTGERATFGPYQKEAVAPPAPFIQLVTAVTLGQWTPNVNEVTFQVLGKGDNGESGHDNINACDSYFCSGFDHLEVWDNNTQLTAAGAESSTFTVTGQGWHKIWAKSVDKVTNASEWTIVEFGLGTATPTPPPTPVSDVGKITFDPNETTWTNTGKADEGEGKYPVKVTFTGSNPYQAEGKATITTTTESTSTDSDGNETTTTTVSYSTTSFTVSWPFESIAVSGDASATINGTSGTVNIEKEGYQLQLHGEGSWGSAEYTLPSVADNQSISVDYMPPDPSPPTGDSGDYNLDWTKPTVDFSMDGKQIFSEANGAIRKASVLGSDDSFYGTLTEKDNLSGAKSIAYKWTYGDTEPSSGYTTIYTSADTNTNKSDEVIEKEIEKPVGDNLYLHVKIKDIAGNSTYACYGPYEDPIKLKDFEVTDIRDPRWDDVFWKDKKFTEPTGVTYKVDQLPIDEASHPTIRNAYPKKGYAFYFDVTSEYLYREADRIEVTPSFYYLSGSTRVPLDLYYNLDNNPFIAYGSTNDTLKLNLDTSAYGTVWIGGLSKLTLTKGVRIVKGKEWIDGWKDTIQYTNGKIQWWFGKYLIPATSTFVKQGESPRPENIINSDNIIVNFQIVGFKNGVETLSLDQMFSYNLNQWEAEGGPKNSNYESGDVMVYDNKYSALSDYTAHVIQ